MSIDKMIQALTEMKKNWGNVDVRVEKTSSSGLFTTTAYVEPWLTVTKPANGRMPICIVVR